MKKIIKKYWPLIALIASFLLERSLNIFSSIGFSPEQADLAKAFGTLIYGYFFTSNYNVKLTENQQSIVGSRPGDRG
tara:strand:+ start:115 stop:345 length:231 start_codon:yes stop_codon:yes gene_type:complete